MDVGQIVKPALARGEMRLIGATTIGEYRKYIESDPALERRFQLVWINEPSKEEAIEILGHAGTRGAERFRDTLRRNPCRGTAL